MVSASIDSDYRSGSQVAGWSKTRPLPTRAIEELGRSVRTAFTTWHVLPGLRARAERSHITPGVRRIAGEQIKCATALLQWLGERSTALASCGQADIDAWSTEYARTRLRGSLNWARQGLHCRCSGCRAGGRPRRSFRVADR